MKNIERTNGHLEESYLETQEQFFNFKFPKDYRLFLLENNGGVTNKKIFFYKNSKNDGSILDRLFGFTPKPHYNILIYFKAYKGRIPYNMFPIGYDPGGNLILISVEGPNYGKIYYWDHEQETEPADYSNLTLIADSFDEFINNLKSEDEVDMGVS